MVDALYVLSGMVSGGMAGVIIGWYLHKEPQEYEEGEPIAVPFVRIRPCRNGHRFDTMQADGWWTCGVCGERAPDHKQPQMRVKHDG